MMHIAVKNQSSVVADMEVHSALAAFQIQVTRDFSPIWDTPATLTMIDKNMTPTSCPMIVVLDDADQAGALGYHDLQTSGQPIGKVFAKTTKDYGGQWTVTFSHELLEMIADPYINLMAMNDLLGRFYAYEVCDAVEDDTLGYMINGIMVSDFVKPHWFDEHAPPVAGAFSFRGHVGAPFELATGGYISYLDLSDGQWHQDTAMHPPESLSPAQRAMKLHDAIPRPGSRRERRRRGRQSWIHSVTI